MTSVSFSIVPSVQVGFMINLQMSVLIPAQVMVHPGMGVGGGVVVVTFPSMAWTDVCDAYSLYWVCCLCIVRLIM